MLLKTLVVAAGTLLSAAVVSTAPAAAAGYHGRVITLQHARSIKTGYGYAGYARGRYARAGIARVGIARAGIARPYAGARYAVNPAFRTRRISMVRGIGAYRTVARGRFVRRAFAHARPLTFARRDQLIRSAVGPSSIFAPAVTPAVGGGTQVGQASYYALSSRTATGGHVGAATCAHRSLPFGTRILVTNLANAHQMVLTVNDRGPFTGGRILDVSKSAAGFLGMLHSGTAPVRVQVVGRS